MEVKERIAETVVGIIPVGFGVDGLLISVSSLRIFVQVKIGIAETVVCLRIARLESGRLIVSGNGLLVLLVVKKRIALSVEVFSSRLRLLDNNWRWLMSTAAAR